ncbi:hypothetical protein A8C32_00360 [Flavivirga aquatica]|uniref:Uncharacterized protein n=1 Tax=Flavivirga aquatica TaxID=1849968 RepID=A0A1E5TBK6_9FLAO|nr:hypothetical protein [Flavivirga aquatica]OEK08765.1 hypothetical protein A8C32_00360 [Flavivirga aquatica]
MKNLTIYISSLIILLTTSLHAQNDSLEKVIEKGKNDLIEILRTSKDQFNFGISPEALEQSKSASQIVYKEINIKRLLDYNGQGIDGIISKEQKLIIPFVNNSKVIATIGVVRSGKVTELINHRYRNELSELPNDIKDRGFENINIVYVPNLNTIVYMDDNKSYTSYKGRNIREAISTEKLITELKVDAQSFQKKYGDKIKEGKLLN